MRALDRKLARDLLGSWLLLLAVASIIAVGVCCHIAMHTAVRNLREAQQIHYAVCRMADFSIELKKAPLAEVARLETLPGVTAVRPRLRFSVTVDLEQSPDHCCQHV